MTRRRRRPAQIKNTAVPDRTGSLWALGDEARLVVAALLRYGADPTRAVVPGATTDEERSLWMKSRSGPARGVPLWLLDYAGAILAQIPGRKDRPAHRPRDPLLEQVELLGRVGSVAEAAWQTTALELRGKAYAAVPKDKHGKPKEPEKPVTDDEIKARAAKLARAVYRRRKKDAP